MENQKLGQEPAFPVDGENQSDSLKYGLSGMSKRFYAACFAMQGIAAIHSTRSDIDNEWICKTAFNMEDELLKQENL